MKKTRLILNKQMLIELGQAAEHRERRVENEDKNELVIIIGFLWKLCDKARIEEKIAYLIHSLEKVYAPHRFSFTTTARWIILEVNPQKEFFSKDEMYHDDYARLCKEKKTQLLVNVAIKEDKRFYVQQDLNQGFILVADTKKHIEGLLQKKALSLAEAKEKAQEKKCNNREWMIGLLETIEQGIKPVTFDPVEMLVDL